MTARGRRAVGGIALVIVPPTCALVLASLAVGVDRHARDPSVPSPALWDALFPVFLLASIFSVPVGVYLLWTSLGSNGA